MAGTMSTSQRYEGVVEKDEKGYLVRLPEELVNVMRWKEGDRVIIEMSEWRGRLVVVLYKPYR